MPDLKVSEVAEVLNCDKKSVYSLIQIGSLKAYRIGKCGLRVTPEELDRFRNNDKTVGVVLG